LWPFILTNRTTLEMFSVSWCIFITTPFRWNRRSCLLSESGNATFRSYVQTTCISNWLIWKQKVCKTFLSSSRNISIMNQIKPNLVGMVPGWVPFKIVSNSPDLHSRWLLLLKI
jgi:hypothetical protein